MTTNSSMTVYNKFVDSFTHKTVFKRHVVENVFWDDSKGVSLGNAERSVGYENDDNVIVFVPFDSNDLSDYKNSKNYNGTGWTLNAGDYMIKGIVDIEEVEGLKDLSEYEVFVIGDFDEKDYGSSNMQHFEIRGK